MRYRNISCIRYKYIKRFLEGASIYGQLEAIFPLDASEIHLFFVRSAECENNMNRQLARGVADSIVANRSCKLIARRDVLTPNQNIERTMDPMEEKYTQKYIWNVDLASLFFSVHQAKRAMRNRTQVFVTIFRNVFLL